MLLGQLEVEMLTKVRLGVGHFEILLPTVVKSNFFSFNVKSIICSKILKNVVPLQRIYSQSITVFPYYYNISDNLFRYANYLIKYAVCTIQKSQAEMDSARKNTPGSVEKSLVMMIIK